MTTKHVLYRLFGPAAKPGIRTSTFTYCRPHSFVINI